MDYLSAHSGQADISVGNTRELLCRPQIAQRVQRGEKTTHPCTAVIGTAAHIPMMAPTVRPRIKKDRPKNHQREIFLGQLRDWASNHDSSVHFNGSIHLPPQGSSSREVLELGKSFTCILSKGASGDVQKKVVVRLFQSQRHDSKQYMPGKEPPRLTQYVAPYLLVVRSGSGWVPAREFFDRYHFTKSGQRQEATSQYNKSETPKTNARRSGSTGSATSMPSSGWGSSPTPAVAANLEPSLTAPVSTYPVFNTRHQQPGSIILSSNNSVYTERSRNILAEPTQVNNLLFSAKDTVAISPSFRLFSRLPPELQDEILYQAIDYTGSVSLIRTTHSKHSATATEAPTTLSKLFRISKSINFYLVPHIFRCTNFHFGITGFTKFLWQLGPVNRSNLRHLTFRFGASSLLHSIRWLAPDLVWELFEPPVATNPPTLINFWRCQLQDLMKELHLSTVLIDGQHVPPRDIPMVVRALSAVLGSVGRVYVLSNGLRVEYTHEGCSRSAQGCQTAMHGRIGHHHWRSLSLQYYQDYKHQRWHMKPRWMKQDDDLLPLLNACMDDNKDFFDS